MFLKALRTGIIIVVVSGLSSFGSLLVATAWAEDSAQIGVSEGATAALARMGKTLQAKEFSFRLRTQRARETCTLAGLNDKAVIDVDLAEWNYGQYEGVTPKQIHEGRPGWLIFRDGCPGGESPEQMGARVDRVIARPRAADGDVALFAHGHVLRVLAARWIGLLASAGQHFLLNTGTLCILGYYRDVPAMRVWNGPLVGPTGG